MSKKNTSIMTLLVLVVVLLVIVSSRVSPVTAENGGKSVSVPDDTQLSAETMLPGDAQPVETTPVPTEDPRENLPDLALYDWQLKLVNNASVLSSSFAPDVSEVADGQYFDTRAIDALNSMIDGAKSNGMSVYISTAYRPYQTQAYLFFGKASQIAWDGTVEYADAEMLARELVAYPGTSEHQLGLAADLIDSSSTAMIAEDVEDQPLLVWLREHCAEYGFILRYPKDKQDITGWYEPWHFRYVGVEAAEYIMENGLCLEEFLALY